MLGAKLWGLGYLPDTLIEIVLCSSDGMIEPCGDWQIILYGYFNDSDSIVPLRTLLMTSNPSQSTLFWFQGYHISQYRYER